MIQESHIKFLCIYSVTTFQIADQMKTLHIYKWSFSIHVIKFWDVIPCFFQETKWHATTMLVYSHAVLFLTVVLSTSSHCDGNDYAHAINLSPAIEAYEDGTSIFVYIFTYVVHDDPSYSCTSHNDTTLSSMCCLHTPYVIDQDQINIFKLKKEVDVHWWIHGWWSGWVPHFLTISQVHESQFGLTSVPFL